LSPLFSKVQLKQRRIRQDAVHQIAHEITRDHDRIVIETLNVKAMGCRAKGDGSSRKRLGRSIQRNPIGGLLQTIEQKAIRRGREVIKAERFFPSSKTCSSCGEVHRGLKRGDEVWTCPSCGTTHDRDGNAPVNLVRLMAVPRDTRELMPCSTYLRRMPPSQEGGPRTRLRASVVSTGAGPVHGEGTLRGDAHGSLS
jgi:IS605 OrfB family transposase